MTKYLPHLAIIVSAVLAVVAVVYFYYQTAAQNPETAEPQAIVEKVEEAEAIKDAPKDLEVKDVEVKNTEIGGGDESGIALARVKPDGSMVVAGRAKPGSTVRLMNNGEVIGQATASEDGEWVIVPDNALDLGQHLLSVEITEPDGETKVASMALAIDRQNAQDLPLVAMVPYTDNATGEAVLLQAPTNTDAKTDTTDATDTTAAAIRPSLNIRAIEAITAEQMQVTGEAKGGASVKFSINGERVASTAPANGGYTVRLPIEAGEHFTLKATMQDKDGKNIASVRVKLNNSQISRSLDGNSLVIVHRGDALWRISYRSYGKGIRYVDIYRQNRDIISDPDLIYPDQILIVPKQ